MFVPRTLHDFGELVMLFNERALPLRVDNDQQIIDSGPVRLQWDARHPFLHVTRSILTVPADRARDIERAIAEHNHESRLPVLDFDAKTGVLSFRVTTLVLVDGVRLDLLDAILTSVDVRVDELRARLAPLVD
jgi:hypothetical protein